MPALIPVTSTPQKISGTASKPYLISNDPSSLSTIYLGQDSSVSPYNYGVKLSPSGSLTWTEITKEVWAITDTGGSAKVSVMYEASGTFSSQVASVSANLPTLLQTVTIPFVLGVGALNTVVPDTIIQNYASVRVVVTVNLTTASVSGTTSLVNGAYIRFVGIQSDTAQGNSLSGLARNNEAQWTFGDGFGGNTGLQSGIATYEFPVINNYLTSSYIQFSTGTGNPTGTITVKIYGQGKVLTDSLYTNFPANSTMPFPNQSVAQSGLMFNFTETNAVSNQYEPPSQNGLANILLSSSSTTLTRIGYSLWFAKQGSTYLAFKNLVANPSAIGGALNDQIIFPALPILFRTEATGTGNSNFTITQYA